MHTQHVQVVDGHQHGPFQTYHDDLTDLDYSKSYVVTNKGRARSVRGQVYTPSGTSSTCACMNKNLSNFF